MFLEDSMIPLVEIPTWATWTKEWGAGLEIIPGLTGEQWAAFRFSFLSFATDLKRNGWKTETRVVITCSMTIVSKRKLTVMPRPIRDLFVEDVCFLVFIEAESKHTTLRQNALFDDENAMWTYCSGEIVKERFVSRVLEDLGDGERPNHTVGLHVNEAKPVLLLETQAMSATLRGGCTIGCVSIASEDENAFKLGIAPV
jgi:hypothetical protein